MSYDSTSAGVLGGQGGNLTAWDQNGNGQMNGMFGAGNTGGWNWGGTGGTGGAWGSMGGSYGGGGSSGNTTTGSGSNTGSTSGNTSSNQSSNGTTTQSAMDPALWSAFSSGLQGAIANPGTPDSVTQGIINKGTDQLSEAQKSAAMDLSNRANAMGGGQSGGLQSAMAATDASYAGQKSNLARDARLAAEQTRQDRLLQALNIASHEPMNQQTSGNQSNNGTSNTTTTNNYTTTETAPSAYGSYGGGSASNSMGFASGRIAPTQQGLQTAGLSQARSQFPMFSVSGRGGSSGNSEDFGDGLGGEWGNGGIQFPQPGIDLGPDANRNTWGQLDGYRTAF